MSTHPYQQPRFYDWILRYEAGVMKSSVIASVRTSAGLGFPLAKYTTDGNEYFKHMLITIAALALSLTTCMILLLCNARKWKKQYMGWVSTNSIRNMNFCVLIALGGS